MRYVELRPHTDRRGDQLSDQGSQTLSHWRDRPASALTPAT